MTAVSKKSRIITRSRYRRTDLLRQGKCRCAAFTDLLCCAPRSPRPQGREQGEDSIEKQLHPAGS